MSIGILTLPEKIARVEYRIRAEKRAIKSGAGDPKLLDLLSDVAKDLRARLPEYRCGAFARIEDRIMAVKLGEPRAAQSLGEEVAKSWAVVRQALAAFAEGTEEDRDTRI